ncbi:uncharacterized protein EAF01_010965 [Botrytis porri]|uniref:uncharacterized protein n=1 Tax=Botrytis porri TaxID=87229 RepID=UPI001902388E|nr:uncharacterized protein EAF01_010965 [Botrytis porri]KAF7887811.1 hypothetical protein EAF01_010965 [Botrytis porri]
MGFKAADVADKVKTIQYVATTTLVENEIAIEEIKVEQAAQDLTTPEKHAVTLALAPELAGIEKAAAAKKAALEELIAAGIIGSLIEDEPRMVLNPYYKGSDYDPDEVRVKLRWVMRLLNQLSALDVSREDWAKENGDGILSDEDKFGSAWNTSKTILMIHISDRRYFGPTGVDTEYPILIAKTKEEFEEYFKRSLLAGTEHECDDKSMLELEEFALRLPPEEALAMKNAPDSDEESEGDVMADLEDEHDNIFRIGEKVNDRGK